MASTQDFRALCLKDASILLGHEYLPMESGYAVTSDGMTHVAASTYMHGVTSTMIDWWFGFIKTTEFYKLWHPRDHLFSDWEGPRDNTSTYIGGHHLVKEYIGGDLASLKISFKDPGLYFGEGWRQRFAEKGYATAVCGRVHNWEPETGKAVGVGHLIHLIKTEPDGCRMRSRFWLGDIEGVDEPQPVPESFAAGLQKHATEEMAILANILPGLYARLSKEAVPVRQEKL